MRPQSGFWRRHVQSLEMAVVGGWKPDTAATAAAAAAAVDSAVELAPLTGSPRAEAGEGPEPAEGEGLRSCGRLGCAEGR